MRIIHIVLGRANPNRMNGVNRVVHNLATSQKKIGIDVSVWGITKSANLPDEELDRAYSVQWFLPSFISFLVTSELKSALKTENNAFFHLHGGFIPLFYSLSSLLTNLNRRYFLTPHGTYTEGAMKGNSMIKKWYFKLLEKRLISRLHSVQCLGHAEESDLKKICPNSKITLIPNGQNWEELKVSNPLESLEGFVIGYCGRVTKWQKGLDILIEGFKIYRDEFLGQGKLHIIGDGEYRKEMQEITVDSQIDDYVVFHGPQFGEDKIRLMKNMRVFVHTSRNEGLPTAVIEAVSLGVPCIVSEMTSMDRYIRDYDAGFALSILSPNEVAKTFKVAEDLFDNHQLSLLGQNAERLARESFDWDVIAKQTIDMYATN